VVVRLLPAEPVEGHPPTVNVIAVEVAVLAGDEGVSATHGGSPDAVVNAMPPVTEDVTETVVAVPGVYKLPLTVQLIVTEVGDTVRPELMTVRTATPISVPAVPVFAAARKLNVPPTAVPSDAQPVVAPVIVNV
jgi:hypothetical protein